MIKIPLTRGKFAIIDDEDFKLVSHLKWSFASAGYAISRFPNYGKLVLMHRIILGAKKGQSVDHKNGNGLDNRKSNIRLCSHKQNMMNRKKPSHNTSGYKGVTWDKQMKKWRVQIRHSETNSYIGLFKNIIDAANAYDKKAKEIFGEFARLNF